MKFEENNFDVENLRAEPQFKKHFRQKPLSQKVGRRLDGIHQKYFQKLLNKTHGRQIDGVGQT